MNRIHDPDTYAHAEDYVHWVELSRAHHVTSLPEPSLKVRRHEGQVGHRHSRRQSESMRRIQAGLLGDMGVAETEIDWSMQTNLGAGCAPVFGYAQRIEQWINRLQAANEEKQRFDDQSF
jgi:hypothetical protein